MEEKNFEAEYLTKTAMKQYTKDLEDCIFKFLKENGFRPKKTDKYYKYLKRKLKKQNLEIVIIVMNKEVERIADNTYYYKYSFVPTFVKIKKGEN